jgi:hypothetical protein
MGKALAQKVSLAAIETTLQAAMPELLKRLDGLHKSMDERFTSVQKSMDERFDKVDQRFVRIEERLLHVERAQDQSLMQIKEEIADRHERLVAVMSELGQRISRVEGALDAYSRIVNTQVATLTLPRQGTSKRRRAG